MSHSPTPTRIRRGRNYIRQNLRVIINKRGSEDSDKLRALELLSEIQGFTRKKEKPEKPKKPVPATADPSIEHGLNPLPEN